MMANNWTNSKKEFGPGEPGPIWKRDLGYLSAPAYPAGAIF